MKKGLYRLEVYYKQNATESEKEVLRYLIHHTREAVEMDIHTIAQKCFCSPATIIRLCKKNGFLGFKELKQALQNDINFSKQLKQANLTVHSDDKIQNIVARVLNTNIIAIQNTYNLLDFDELGRVAALLLSGRYIYLYGIGASFLVAKDFQQKFERVGKRTFLYEDIHLQLVSSTNLEPGDIAVIVSYSGLTKEIIEIARNVKLCGGKIIAITKYGTNKLSSMSDYNLFVPMLEQPLRVGASSSRVSQLSVVDIVYNTYLSMEKDKSMEKILSTNKLLEKKEEN